MSLKHSYIMWLIMLLVSTAYGQQEQTSELLIRYTFDSCGVGSSSNIVDDRIGGDKGVIIGNENCSSCGRDGTSFLFDGQTGIQGGEVSSNFPAAGPFTLSFYLRPVRSSKTYMVFSRASDDCDASDFMLGTYNPVTRIFRFTMRSIDGEVVLEGRVPADKCWFHIAIARRSRLHRLYIDGKQVDEHNSINTIDLMDNFYRFGSSPCDRIQSLLSPYEGLMDEVRLYNDFLSEENIQFLARPLNFINLAADDRSVFRGDTIPVSVESICIEQFTWRPSAGVLDPSAGETSIVPTDDETYVLEMRDESGCSTFDTLEVRVLELADFDCLDLKIANAFTPNQDGLNDDFGIQSARVLSELLEFEVYDRKGNLLWQTTSLSDRWDGYYRGQLLPPDTYMYKIRYRCDDEIKVFSGTVYLMR